jgi:hypothetical protein
MTPDSVTHVQRIFDRLETEQARAAFFELIEFCLRERRLNVFPLSRGAFSAIHIATTSNARPYADAEFAFKGAKSHLRFWFRQPGLNSGLVSKADLLAKFGYRLQHRADGEVVVDLFSREDAAEVANFLLDAIQTRSVDLE